MNSPYSEFDLIDRIRRRVSMRSDVIVGIGDDAAVLPAMFEAALSGFPNPPTGVRRIDIEIPR